MEGTWSILTSSGQACAAPWCPLVVSVDPPNTPPNTGCPLGARTWLLLRAHSQSWAWTSPPGTWPGACPSFVLARVVPCAVWVRSMRSLCWVPLIGATVAPSWEGRVQPNRTEWHPKATACGLHSGEGWRCPWGSRRRGQAVAPWSAWMLGEGAAGAGFQGRG